MAFLCGNSEEELRGILCELRTRSCAASLKVSNQYELPLRASAGVAWYPRQARDFETLVRYADFAMYMQSTVPRAYFRNLIWKAIRRIPIFVRAGGDQPSCAG